MTDQERKAMEMALDALEDSMYPQKKQFDAIVGLKQALNVDAIDTSSTYVDKNEKREHEPVAWMHPDGKNYKGFKSPLTTFMTNGWTPLYTAPPSKPQDVDVGIDVTELGTHIVVRRGNEVIKSEFYHAPKREWVSLTKEEMEKATRISVDELLDHIYENGTTAEGVSYLVNRITRAIEAALKEKNNG